MADQEQLSDLDLPRGIDIVIDRWFQLDIDARKEWFRETTRTSHSQGNRTATYASDELSRSDGTQLTATEVDGLSPVGQLISLGVTNDAKTFTNWDTEATSDSEQSTEASSCVQHTASKGENAIVRKIHQEREGRETLRQFYEKHGFRGPCARKKTRPFVGAFTFPLHKAAAKNDHRVVKLLLMAGADPAQVDSARRTARDVAMRCDRTGSHANIISELNTHPVQRLRFSKIQLHMN